MAISRRIYDHLPIYTKLSDRNSLVEKICDSFQQGYYSIEDLLSNLYLYFDPELAPIESLDWLGQLVGLFPVGGSSLGTGIPEEWNPDQKRFAILNAQSFFKKKGSIEGIKLGYTIWLFKEKERNLILIKDTREKIYEKEEPRNINDFSLEYNNLSLHSINFPDFRYWKNTQDKLLTTKNTAINRFVEKEIIEKYNQNPTNRYDIHVTLTTNSIIEGSQNLDRINQEILPNLITNNTFLWYRNITTLTFIDLLNPNGYFPLIHKSKNWVLTIYTKKTIYYINPISLFFVNFNDDLILLKQKIIEDNNFSNKNISQLNNYYLDVDLSKYHKLPYYTFGGGFKDLVLQFPFYNSFSEEIVKMSLDVLDKDNYNLPSLSFYKETKKISLTQNHVTCFEFIIPYQIKKFFGLYPRIINSNNTSNISVSLKISGDFNVNSQPSQSQSHRQVNFNVSASDSVIRVFLKNANQVKIDVFSGLANADGNGIQYKVFNLAVQSQKSEFIGESQTLSQIFYTLSSGSIIAQFNEASIKTQGTLIVTSSEAELKGDTSINDPNIIGDMTVISEVATFVGTIGYVISSTLNVFSTNSSFIGDIIHINPIDFNISISNQEDFALIITKALVTSNDLSLSINTISEFNEVKIILTGNGTFNSVDATLDGTITTS